VVRWRPLCDLQRRPASEAVAPSPTYISRTCLCPRYGPRCRTDEMAECSVLHRRALLLVASSVWVQILTRLQRSGLCSVFRTIASANGDKADPNPMGIPKPRTTTRHRQAIAVRQPVRSNVKLAAPAAARRRDHVRVPPRRSYLLSMVTKAASSIGCRRIQKFASSHSSTPSRKTTPVGFPVLSIHRGRGRTLRQYCRRWVAIT